MSNLRLTWQGQGDYNKRIESMAQLANYTGTNREGFSNSRGTLANRRKAMIDSKAVIRTARVEGPCANASAARRGVEWAQHCALIIRKGDRYSEGEMDPYKAGGFGRDRVCMSCVDRGLA